MLLLRFCRQLWRFDRCFEFGCVTSYTYHATADHRSTLPIEPERAPPPGERLRTLPQPRCIGGVRERLRPLRNAVRQLWAAFDTMLEHLVQSPVQWRIGQRRKSEDALYHKDKDCSRPPETFTSRLSTIRSPSPTLDMTTT